MRSVSAAVGDEASVHMELIVCLCVCVPSICCHCVLTSIIAVVSRYRQLALFPYISFCG